MLNSTIFYHSIRRYATKPNLSLLSRLRKDLEGISLTKAKEALLATNNDYDAAIEWLQKDAAQSGAKKAEKVKGRIAKEGLIGIATGPNGQGGAIVEVNSETDFVARNSIFQSLVTQIASTAYLLHTSSPSSDSSSSSSSQPLALSSLLQSPLLPHPSSTSQVPSSKTVHESIIETIGKLGENVSIRRCHLFQPSTSNQFRVSSGYVHGESALSKQNLGKIGAFTSIHLSNFGGTVESTDSNLLTLLMRLSKQLSQIVVGFNPGSKEDLLNTSFMFPVYSMNVADPKEIDMGSDKTVGNVLEVYGKEFGSLIGSGNGEIKLNVDEFVRYEVGEGITKEEENFAEEVKKQLAK